MANLYSLFTGEGPTQEEQAQVLAAALRGQRGLASAFTLDPLMAQTGKTLLADIGQREGTLADAGKQVAAGRFQQLLAQRQHELGMEKERYQQGEEWKRLNAQLGAKSKVDQAAAEAAQAKALAEAESGLRKEFTGLPVTKDTAAAAAAFESVKTAFDAKTPAGDMAGIFAFMKSLDPGSTVNTGEYANASNAANVPDQIRNMYNKAVKGEKLTDGQRADFVARAGDRFKAQTKIYNQHADAYRNIAPKGVNLRNVIPVDYDLDAPLPANGGPTPRPGQTAVPDGVTGPPRVVEEREIGGTVIQLMSDGTKRVRP